MPIPDFQTIMLPLLTLTADDKPHNLREAVDGLAAKFGLTAEELNRLVPSGQQTVFHNRVSWAKTYISKAGLLETPQRGYFKITGRGKDVLSQRPEPLNVKYLERFSEFQEFQKRKRQRPEPGEDESEPKTPIEALEDAYSRIRTELADEVLERIKSCSPGFFERLVVEVLVAMGYGGSRRDAAETMGKSGDGGIDGIIKEDRLGLDVIYVQAKRWERTVGRPEIQQFVGALQGQRARKGVFITTSDFTKDAVAYAQNLDSKVVLIDGSQLANFMIDYDIGVSKVVSYDVKRADSDYFSEE